MKVDKNRSLENRTMGHELTKPYAFTSNNGYDVHDEGRSLDLEEPEFTPVPTSHMPSGVRGWYNPDTVTGQVVNDAFSRTISYVTAHERGHHYNKPHADSPRQHEEDMADAYAAARTGYVLRPFGVDEDYFRVHYNLNNIVSGTQDLSSKDTYSLHR